MATFRIPYGNSTILAELPERTRVLKNTNQPLPALPDPAQAIRDALNSPIAHDPLSKLVNSKSKVTIAFDDPIGFLPAEKKPGFEEVAVKVLLEELDKLGVNRHNIRLVCAIGLHRMWTQSELADILGDDLVSRASPSWLFNFDAEDKDNLVFLGETKRNQEVEVSRLVTDSDQLIYVSHPWSHFNGGWKTVAVGLSSWRSIRHHHRPFAKASGKSSLDPKRSAFPKQNVPLVKPGGIVIFCHPCPNDFNLVHNPSYAEMFDDLLPHTKDPVELWELYAEEYANRPDFVHKYRYGYAFHGTHPLILYGQGLYGLKYVGKAFLAGATDFEAARRLSLEPFTSVEEAIAEAENLMGKDCSITYLDMPQSFVCNVEP